MLLAFSLSRETEEIDLGSWNGSYRVRYRRATGTKCRARSVVRWGTAREVLRARLAFSLPRETEELVIWIGSYRVRCQRPTGFKCRARPVLRWGTAREVLGVLLAFSLSLSTEETDHLGSWKGSYRVCYQRPTGSKNYHIRIHAHPTRQPLVKGERLVRVVVSAAILSFLPRSDLHVVCRSWIGEWSTVYATRPQSGFKRGLVTKTPRSWMADDFPSKTLV